MIVHDQEFLITEGELDVLGLDVSDGHGRPDELLSVHRVENAESECDSSGEHILGVLGHIHGLDGLLYVEDTDSRAVVGVIHADVAVIGAGEQEVAILVEHDFADWAGVAGQIYGLHIFVFVNY